MQLNIVGVYFYITVITIYMIFSVSQRFQSKLCSMSVFFIWCKCTLRWAGFDKVVLTENSIVVISVLVIFLVYF